MILQTHNFDELIQTLKNNAESFSFELSDLPDAYEYTPTPEKRDASNIRTHIKFDAMFRALDLKRTHCLYWFELNDKISCSKLIEIQNNARLALGERQRTIPVRNMNCDSNVLYVGIRRGGFTKKWQLSNISGRMIQHLGYYYKGSTQGLQLAHWAVEAGHTITFKVVQFDKDFPDNYLGAVEKIMAHNLKPLCGKH